MGSDSSENVRDRIVTFASLRPPARTAESLASTDLTFEDRLRVERYYQIMERLRQETLEVGEGLMITAPDAEVSQVQSELARQASEFRSLGSGGQEVKFGTGVTGGDWFGWLFSLMDHVGENNAHPIVRPRNTRRASISDTATIAVTADWGTGLYGAPKIARQIAAVGSYDLLVHLGDIYYSGTKEEVQSRFLDQWPVAAGKRSIAVNGNHEMYSGGFGYYDLVLPAIGQDSSYLAVENSEWLLLFLDTAYLDHDIDSEQLAWINLILKAVSEGNGRPKKLLIFSHHQLFSRLDSQGPRLKKALRHLLDSQAIAAWYWGHEHQCVLYDRHPTYGLFARCLGNGGIPEPRKTEVREAATAKKVGAFMWKQMSATSECPSSWGLDGPNPDIPGEEERFVPHSYMTLELKGPALVERVIAADGTELWCNEIR